MGKVERNTNSFQEWALSNINDGGNSTILYQYNVKIRGEVASIAIINEGVVYVCISLSGDSDWSDGDLIERAINNFKAIIKEDNEEDNGVKADVPKELRDRVYAVISNPSKMIPAISVP